MSRTCEPRMIANLICQTIRSMDETSSRAAIREAAQRELARYTRGLSDYEYLEVRFHVDVACRGVL